MVEKEHYQVIWRNTKSLNNSFSWSKSPDVEICLENKPKTTLNRRGLMPIKKSVFNPGWARNDQKLQPLTFDPLLSSQCKNLALLQKQWYLDMWLIVVWPLPTHLIQTNFLNSLIADSLEIWGLQQDDIWSKHTRAEENNSGFIQYFFDSNPKLMSYSLWPLLKNVGFLASLGVTGPKISPLIMKKVI